MAEIQTFDMPDMVVSATITQKPPVKIGRNYQLKIQRNNSQAIFSSPVVDGISLSAASPYLTVQYPLTVEFEVNQLFMGSGFANFRIYNLSPNSRWSITQPSYDYDNQQRDLQFFAGYGPLTNIPLMYRGWIRECSSRREGVKTITEIHSISTAYISVTSHFSKPYSAGTSYNSILNDLLKQLVKDGGVLTGTQTPFYTIGQVAPFPVSQFTKRDFPLEGNTLSLIKNLVGWNNISVVNNIINIRQVSQNSNYSGTVIPTISSANGIIGVPKIEGSYIYIDTIMDPGLNVGQNFNLVSTEIPNQFNGQYTIQGLIHKGTISGSTCGDAITTIQAVFYGAVVDVVQGESFQI